MSEFKHDLETLFTAARQLTDPNQRRAFLDAACADQPTLRHQLDHLLAVHPEADEFFSQPAAEAGPARLAASQLGTRARQSSTAATEPPLSSAPGGCQSPGEELGTRIGRYKLLQKIGEGGCGVVYMAEQEEPVRRKVAFKVIKLGMDTRSVIARFEAERQALAMMDHPNIARIHDAGATETGRPYFVMELVRGKRITDYCDQQRLSTVERLKLFTQVCDAIQHAHQKGVIHRDIKPSNILVIVDAPGSPGTPKVIDFGIAKATQERLTAKTLFTAFDQFMGTPDYMSPEQAAMTALDIDTRSDVYSLGVLLYELLTGRTPFDAQELMRSGLDEVRRTIREREPPRPSTRLSTMLAEELTPVAAQRQSEPAKLATLVRGDLDWIVMKALEKDRARRYPTANGLARDIERFLDNQPVVARPPSKLYRLQKLARRNKAAFIAITTAGIVLLLATLVSTWQAVQATHARAGEKHEREQAQRNEQSARRSAYNSNMNLAQQALADGNLGRTRELLSQHLPVAGQPDVREWEWRYLAGLTRSEETQRLIGHAYGISGLCFLDENQLLSVGWDHRTIWWDLSGGRAARTLTNSVRAESVAVAPHKEFAVLNGVEVHSPNDLALLDLNAHLERASPLRSLDWGFATVDVSPSGELAIGSVGELGLWDAFSARKLADFAVSKEIPIAAVRFSPDGQRLAAANQQGVIQIRDVASLSNLFSWRAHEPEGGLFVTVNVLAFSPDGRHLVSAGTDGKVCVWEPGAGKRLAELKGHRAPVLDASFSPDGKWLATASLDQTLGVWETTSWTLMKTFRGHSDEVRRAAWSPSGRLLASGSSDGEILLWDWPAREDSAKAIDLPFTSRFDLSATGDTLLRVTTNAPPIVEIWDTKAQQLVAHYPVPDTNITSSLLLPGGRMAVTGERTGRIGIRELATGREIAGTNAHASEVYRLACSIDGRVLFTASKDNEARVWTLPSLTLRGTFHLDRDFDTAVITADGSLLAVGYTIGWLDLRDLPGGNRRTLWHAHHLNFKALAFSPDGNILASSSWDRTGRLWDLKRAPAQLLRPIAGNLLTIESLAFSPDGSRLAAGTAEGVVKLYDVQTAQEVATFKGHRHAVYGLAFTSEGRELLSASAETLRRWVAPNLSDLKDVEARLAVRRSSLPP